MHNGVFEGKKAKDQLVKILILGESHHYETESTQKTVDGYLDKCRKEGHAEKCHEFFDRIVCAFGKDPAIDRESFWSNVWFGNYIDEPCGVRDSQATKVLKRPGKRDALNKQLFEFIEENKIDIVFCFSRRVYNKLPSLAKGECEEIISVGDYLRTKEGAPKKDYISYCEYLSGPHKCTSKPLKRTVKVYGMLHPSGRYGFAPENYAPMLKKLIEF